ncbi:MAG: adenylate/guanylate cyclase domain-containing protein [Betaproteobacteria bacterium]|nr:adenylate/guanylate cyclase domain-containing protein [Betaproteobacteria bacterium]
MAAQVKYAKNGNVHIAYRVVGEGPIDLVVVPGWVTHLEAHWEDPLVWRFAERLAGFSRLILFDKRGTGLSDPVSEENLPTLEMRMEDVHTVLDAVGSKKAALLGISEGGPMCALFAATYPERTSALVMSGCYAKWIRDTDYPWAPTREEHQAAFIAYEKNWGTPIGFRTVAPSVANDESCRNWWARNLRLGASPGAGIALYRMNIEIDIRGVLPSIRVPTLILHREGDRLINVGNSRYMASRIPDAKYVELRGVDHLPWFGDSETVLDHIEEFLTGVRPVVANDRILSTVLFVDIVGSTERALSMGDSRWRDLLNTFHQQVRQELDRFRGRLIDTAGDGVFASFDGPARAVRCASALRDRLIGLGVTIRSGVHTGECEVAGDKLAGIAVHIGARVAAVAEAGEILVSSTVKDLVAGSGLGFASRGRHMLKGLTDELELYAVTLAGSGVIA